MNINKRALVILVHLVFFSCQGQENKQQQPNVVFIICDDLNDAIQGMGGHQQAITP